MKVGFFVNSWRSCSRKSCFFFFIKNFSDFWIKVFEINQILNHLLYNASYFESRISNASHFEPFFHNSTNFESKVLERSRFREKSFTTHQILKWNWFVKKTDFDESSAFRNSLFYLFTPKYTKLCSYAFSQKPTIVLKKEKTDFL